MYVLFYHSLPSRATERKGNFFRSACLQPEDSGILEVNK